MGDRRSRRRVRSMSPVKAQITIDFLFASPGAKRGCEVLIDLVLDLGGEGLGDGVLYLTKVVDEGALALSGYLKGNLVFQFLAEVDSLEEVLLDQTLQVVTRCTSGQVEGLVNGLVDQVADVLESGWSGHVVFSESVSL